MFYFASIEISAQMFALKSFVILSYITNTNEQDVNHRTIQMEYTAIGNTVCHHATHPNQISTYCI